MPDAADAADSGVLTAPLVIEYPFSRTTGPVLGAFFTALREGFVVGVRAADGRVLVPPVEYDPQTSEALTELVEVGDAGVVSSWCWVADPIDGHPLDGPFAFAMVVLDGADTPMVHAVDTGGDQAAMATGMRVRARWRPVRPDDVDPEDDSTRWREGHVLDIECFEPEGSAA